MKRDFLKELGLEDEVIDKIMAEHGKTANAFKDKADAAEAQVTTLTGQLDEANKAIKGFEDMDIEAVKQSAKDWEAKFNQAQADAAAELAKVRYDTAMTNALTEAKARNPKAVAALLDSEALKLNEKDGTIVGLNEQLEAIKKDNAYLFEEEAPAEPLPSFSAKTTQTKVGTDAFSAAMRKGAGLTQKE
jgi:hypothetical protein